MVMPSAAKVPYTLRRLHWCCSDAERGAFCAHDVSPYRMLGRNWVSLAEYLSEIKLEIKNRFHGIHSLISLSTIQ